jgi:hypothetical protein
MRVGDLERDEPISLEVRPCRAATKDVRVRGSQAHEGRRGEGRAISVREKTLEGVKPMRATCSVTV